MQYYPNYYQTIANQEANIQRQIEGLTQQLQQTQNLRNQMMQYQNQQMIPQQQVNNQQMQQALSTQFVDDFENISVNSIPMDNNGALFVKRDGTEIQMKRWNSNGQIVSTSYLPQIQNSVANSSTDNEKSKFGLSEDFVATFNEQMQAVMDRLDMLEDVVNNKPKRLRRKDVSNEISDSTAITNADEQ